MMVRHLHVFSGKISDYQQRLQTLLVKTLYDRVALQGGFFRACYKVPSDNDFIRVQLKAEILPAT